eukprot:TRINITY_DN13764_c0_g1_i1.p1 TRINITY_DN13764_c0_g1~~TRINITY_DN13764_c0_g1_i1.p1  ORF type:complete len:432 (-),score=79.75 TRINITY_DN13764_c0_g1_i1:109-1320(-)
MYTANVGPPVPMPGETGGTGRGAPTAEEEARLALARQVADELLDRQRGQNGHKLEPEWMEMYKYLVKKYGNKDDMDPKQQTTFLLQGVLDFIKAFQSPQQRFSMRCAREACPFLVHSERLDINGFCCKWCHLDWVNPGKNEGWSHGHICQYREAPPGARRAFPVRPSSPLKHAKGCDLPMDCRPAKMPGQGWQAPPPQSVQNSSTSQWQWQDSSMPWQENGQTWQGTDWRGAEASWSVRETPPQASQPQWQAQQPPERPVIEQPEPSPERKPPEVTYQPVQTAIAGKQPRGGPYAGSQHPPQESRPSFRREELPEENVQAPPPRVSPGVQVTATKTCAGDRPGHLAITKGEHLTIKTDQQKPPDGQNGDFGYVHAERAGAQAGQESAKGWIPDDGWKTGWSTP